MARTWLRVAFTSWMVLSLVGPTAAQSSPYTLVGWNNLGMHCMDADYSVFSLLPPYNTIHAQVVDPQGKLVTDPNSVGITVTYQAIADPTGSINKTSMGKTNFWNYAQSLFGLQQPLAVDAGLAGKSMPGAANMPQPMPFDASNGWFIAEGIPLTPYDDMQLKNPYPLMHLVARDQANNVLATLDIVLPVSDEMSCLTCHASGSNSAAMPAAGWVNDPQPQRDMRLNILRLHDERQALDQTFATDLPEAGYDAAGLFATATAATGGRPILCASCHASPALGTPGIGTTKPLTHAMHGHHAPVIDPANNLTLDSSANRSACYRCHPGAVTRCLRGAMGASVAADGTMAMQCQNCHGPMSALADPARTGWLNEPMCQNCHTGTAVSNNGQIRYTSVFTAPGQVRQAVDSTFATTPDLPLPGLSLFRFSTGHGNVKCEACHGSTHAEFPSSHTNDNIQSMQHQGHLGMFVECVNCHGTQPATVNGGPHGMHPIGQSWVSQHGGIVGEGGTGSTPCRPCHGLDYRGTVLSRAKGDRVLSTENFGTQNFWRGFQITCYTCHFGPNGSDRNPNHAPTVRDAAVSTADGTPIPVALFASDRDGDTLTLRIVSQPANGTAGLSGSTATYYPDAGFTGADSFTFAASDGYTDSNLGTVSVAVGGGGGSCPPLQCGHTVADAVGKLINNATLCHIKQADAAFKGKTFDEEACEETDPKSAQAKFDAAIAALPATCPAQVLTNARAARDALLSGAQSLDVRNGVIYCDTTSLRPLDSSGENQGFVPASLANLKCADGVAKYLKKLSTKVVSCQRRWAGARMKGKSFDLVGCQNGAVAKAARARDMLLSGGGCPLCLGQSEQDSLQNSVVGLLTTLRPQMFLCPASP